MIMNCSMDLPILEIYTDGMNKEKIRLVKRGNRIEEKGIFILEG